MQLNIKTAIPGGMPIHKLVTNAKEHAFPDNRCGEVHIKLHQDTLQQLHPTIWDNDIGMASS